MNQKETLQNLLKILSDQGINETDISQSLSKTFLSSDSDNTFIDHDRERRCGFSEVIYGLHKSAESILHAAKEITEKSGHVLISRISASKAQLIEQNFNEVFYDETSQVCYVGKFKTKYHSKLLILSAGTSDLSAAGEAYHCARAFGIKPKLIQDIGVAGLHRLLTYKQEIEDADCIIVAAGMEGALPSVIGGLTSAPIIALPTSVGYGTNLNGITTAMAMLTSCASGLTVVNIDNGFGAAYAALRMIKTFE